MRYKVLVSIVFPVHNGGNQPMFCLKSISKLAFPRHQLEVIVVDNASTDASTTRLKRDFPAIRLIALKKNLGFAKAINIGISQAKGRYIFIGNDDIRFAKQSLFSLINYLKLHPSVGVVGGKIYSNSLPFRISSAGYEMHRWTGQIYPSPHPEISKEPDWIQGCALLITKAALDRVGLLDTKFDHFFEDVDICWRVKKVGLKVIYLPHAHFWHGESSTANRNLPQKYFQWYKNKFRFVLKYLPFTNIFVILFIQAFFITPFRALILKDGRLIPFLKGVYWNIKQFPDTLSARYATK